VNLGAGQLSGRKSNPVDENKRALVRGECGRAIVVVKSGGDIGHSCDPESLNQGICPDSASFHN
jgi:hypothetical protein